MAKQTGSSYDEGDLFDQYLAHRHQPVGSPNLVMEEPAFLSAAGDLAGLRILDLGCGDGTFAKQCLQAGAAHYSGIDNSTKMIAEATAKVDDARAAFHLAPMEGYEPVARSFDLVSCRMALHYVDKIDPILGAAADALVAGGRLIITVVHPVVTAGNTEPDGPRTEQVVHDYFNPGPRTRLWFGRQVTWYHRTVEHYVNALASNGFGLELLSECAPVPQLFDGNDAELARRRQVPLFLLLAAEVAAR